MTDILQLRQLRSSLVEKTTILSRVDLELIQAQSSLLITHAQIERQKVMLQLMDNNGQRQCGHNRLPRRPFSYHGDDLLDRLVMLYSYSLYVFSRLNHNCHSIYRLNYMANDW